LDRASPAHKLCNLPDASSSQIEGVEEHRTIMSAPAQSLEHAECEGFWRGTTV
jgi:hypothetical protein